MEESGLWRLSDEPIVEIGVESGEEPYQFHRIRDVANLGESGVAVLMADQLRFFGRDGIHRRSVGRRGDGPGELRDPVRIVVRPGDTIGVIDTRRSRIPLWTLDGTHLRDEPFELPEGPFPLHEFLYRGHFVRADLPPDRRGELVRAIDRLPAPPDPGRFYSAFLAADGRIWVANGAAPGLDEPAVWTIRDPDGTPIATIETPASYRIASIAADEMAGIHTDSLGVERVRVYGISRPDESGRGPGVEHYLTGAEAATPFELTAVAGMDRIPIERRAAMQSFLRNFATMSEIFYAENDYRYPSNLEELAYLGGRRPLEAPEGSEVAVVRTGSSSLLAIVRDEASGLGCLMGMGERPLSGMPTGRVICGPF